MPETGNGPEVWQTLSAKVNRGDYNSMEVSIGHRIHATDDSPEAIADAEEVLYATNSKMLIRRLRQLERQLNRTGL